MSPDLELELRRLGGVDGIIKLFRKPALGESSDIYAERVELGAALLACKIDLGNNHPNCGTTTSVSSGFVVGTWDCQLQLAGSNAAATLRESWEPKALTVVINALLRGCCSSKARTMLLKVVAALGSRVPEAGVTTQLFDILSEGIACGDTQCCRHVSKALATSLHESPKSAEPMAQDKERLTLLLALAFPSNTQLSRPRDRNLAPPTGVGSEREGAHGAVATVRDRETRENSLSCLCSVVKADSSAASIVHAAGGIRPLFLLAVGDESILDEGHHQPGSPARNVQRRSRTSVPGPLVSKASRRISRPSTTPGAAGAARRRPTTTGGAASSSNSARRSSAGSDKSTSGARTAAASTAGTTDQERPLSSGGISGGVGSAGRGTKAAGKATGLDALRQYPAKGPQEPATSSPLPSPPLPTDGAPGTGGGGTGDGGAQHSSSAGSQLPPRPRPPVVDAVPHDLDPEGFGERVSALAAAILVACLRRKGPVARTATVEQESNDQVSCETNDDVGHNGVSKNLASAPSAGPGAGASTPSRQRTGVPPAPPKPKGLKLRRHARNAGLTRTTGAGKGERKAVPRRSRGRKRSLSWRGRKTPTTAEDENPDTPNASPNQTPRIEQGSPGERKSDQSDEAEEGRNILDHPPGSDRGDGARRLSALQRLFLNRRVDEAATHWFLELERLGAVSRVPGLLDSPSQLLQELGVLILEHGIEEIEGEEEEAEDRVDEEKGANKGHGNVQPVDTTAREDEARRTSRPSTAGRRVHRRRQLLRSVVAGSGTALRSLCWLLLHRHPDVSEGAAAVLLALSNLDPAAGAAGVIGTRPAPSWVVLGLVEQGCVPILRMAAGRLAAAAAAAAAANPSPKVDGEGGRAVEAAARVATAQEAVDGDAEADASVDVGGGGGCGSIARLAARVVLEAVVDEACVRHVDRLVHSVRVSGNRELRANVALAIGILSTGTGRGEGGGGKSCTQSWRSFVSSGALSTVLGMLRSPTGRPAAVAFLRVVSALLERIPAPPDLFSGDLANFDGGLGGEMRGGGRAGAGGDGAPAGAGSDQADTVVLVRDPLCSGREEENRGGRAEAEGIKMACPPREVIFGASPVLRRAILDMPPGELPLLHGRYRAWEEVMAHMGAPHTFAATSASYSTAFLTEIFVLATSFKIEAQANGYACEARRRLGAPRATHTHQSTTDAQDDAEPTVGRPPRIEEATAPSAHDFEGPSSRSIGSASGSEQPGSFGIAPAGTRGDVDHARQASGTDPLGPCESSRSGGGGVRRGGAGSSRFDQHHQHHAESVVFAVLEASLRCCHSWLCREAFGEAVAMMGHGDGEGLPASPRELTAVIALLQRCLSLLRVADGRENNCREAEFGEEAPVH
eukprot:g5838.t1